MAKDPALLFYTSDFLTGTALMTNEEVGIYIRLLCIQHQHNGRIDKDSFKAMAAGHKRVSIKFTEDENGFYNERLETEAIKRNTWVTSRRNNAKGKKAYAKHMVKHMEDEDEDVNVIEDISRSKFKKPSIKDLQELIKEKGYLVNAITFFNHYESNGWLVGKNKMKSWQAAVANWHSRDKDEKKTTSVTQRPETAEDKQMRKDYLKRVKEKEKNGVPTAAT